MFSIRNTKAPALLAAVTVAIACAASPAHAGLEIKLQSAGNTYSETGGSPLTVTRSIGNFTTTVNTGVSGTDPTSLDLSSFNMSSSAGGTLIVTLSADGFTTPVGAANWLSQFSGNSFQGSADVTLQTYLASALMGTDTLLGTLTTSTSNSTFGLSNTNFATTVDPFALTEVLTIVTPGASRLSMDASVVNVPEPASLTLLGSAMIGIGALARRKRNA